MNKKKLPDVLDSVLPGCRCGWRSYVGKPFMRRLGFDPREFELISWMTGWALCGHSAEGAGGDDEEDQEQLLEGGGMAGHGEDRGAPAKRNKRQRGCDGDVACAGPADGESVLADGASAAASLVDLHLGRKMAVGMKCKHLIDQGRLEWLNGVASVQRAELISYVPPSVSGECRLLIARCCKGE